MAAAARRGRLDLPKIALGVDSFLNRDRFKVKYPTFNVVGWGHKVDFMKALAAAGLVPDDAVSLVPEEASQRTEVLTHARSGQKRDVIDDEPPPHDTVPEGRDRDDDDEPVNP